MEQTRKSFRGLPISWHGEGIYVCKTFEVSVGRGYERITDLVKLEGLMKSGYETVFIEEADVIEEPINWWH